jgi:hypothetical protein
MRGRSGRGIRMREHFIDVLYGNECLPFHLALSVRNNVRTKQQIVTRPVWAVRH